MKYKLGDILKMSWGYDQTNVDFFEVTKLVGKTMIEIRKVANKIVRGAGEPQEFVVPVPGEYLTWDPEFAKPLRKKPNAEGRVKIYSWGAGAYPWNGKPAYKTGAMWGH